MTEPAVDLGILLAIASSARDIAIPADTVVFGEVGLSGEIRSVEMAEQRVREAQKLGFQTVILPKSCMRSLSGIQDGIEVKLIPVSTIGEAIGYLNALKK